MPATTNVNKLSVVHKDSGGVSMAFPDVCKTPAPPGPPIPIPYPNVAQSTDTAAGSSTVKVDGNPVMIKSSYFQQSTGDEAGSLNGVISNKIKGKAYPKMYSFDVKFDGENVMRLSDIMLQNGGSPTNSAPACEMQAPVCEMPPEADPQEPEIVRMEWSTTPVVCGDEVSLDVEVQNLSSSHTLLVLVDEEGTSNVYGSMTVNLDGSGGHSHEFIARRGPYLAQVKLHANQDMFDGVQKTPAPLEVKGVSDAKEKKGPFQRTTPKYIQDATGAWVPSGTNYGWEVCYEAEIKRGKFSITRKVDFKLVGGANPSAANRRAWKGEIERVWNRKFKVHRVDCKRGDTCDCGPDDGCCIFPIHVLCEWGSGHGKQVTLNGGTNSATWGSPNWWFSHNWWEGRINVPTTVRAHEFGHLIGMYDEYAAGACDPARAVTSSNTVMSSGSSVAARHYKEFHDWFKAKAGGVLGKTKLLRM